MSWATFVWGGVQFRAPKKEEEEKEIKRIIKYVLRKLELKTDYKTVSQETYSKLRYEEKIYLPFLINYGEILELSFEDANYVSHISDETLDSLSAYLDGFIEKGIVTDYDIHFVFLDYDAYSVYPAT